LMPARITWESHCYVGRLGLIHRRISGFIVIAWH